MKYKYTLEIREDTEEEKPIITCSGRGVSRNKENAVKAIRRDFYHVFQNFLHPGKEE
jgi:hypothetical protein